MCASIHSNIQLFLIFLPSSSGSKLCILSVEMPLQRQLCGRKLCVAGVSEGNTKSNSSGKHWGVVSAWAGNLDAVPCSVPDLGNSCWPICSSFFHCLVPFTLAI